MRYQPNAVKSCFFMKSIRNFMQIIDTANAVNVSLIIQIMHGYFYLAYLVSDFLLTTYMRWPIMRFVLIAAGGVVPLLSFFVERRVHREVTEYLRMRVARLDAPAASAN